MNIETLFRILQAIGIATDKKGNIQLTFQYGDVKVAVTIEKPKPPVTKNATKGVPGRAR